MDRIIPDPTGYFRYYLQAAHEETECDPVFKFWNHDTYLFPLFPHGPFDPVFFFPSSFPNNTSSLSMNRSFPGDLAVGSY
jgi:hypothetical protein